MASKKKPVELTFQQLISGDGIWKKVMNYKGDKTKKAIRVTNTIKKLDFMEYNAATGLLDPEKLSNAPEKFNIQLIEVETGVVLGGFIMYLIQE